MTLHILLIIIVKLVYSKAFRDLNLLEKFIDVMNNTSIPTCTEDWDAKNGNARAHYNRMKSNQTEGLILIGIHGFINVLLLIPLSVFGKLFNKILSIYSY